MWSGRQLSQPDSHLFPASTASRIILCYPRSYGQIDKCDVSFTSAGDGQWGRQNKNKFPPANPFGFQVHGEFVGEPI